MKEVFFLCLKTR